MRYITMEDVKSVIQEPMIQSSIEKDSSILDRLEQGSIDEVCSYIGVDTTAPSCLASSHSEWNDSAYHYLHGGVQGCAKKCRPQGS